MSDGDNTIAELGELERVAEFVPGALKHRFKLLWVQGVEVTQGIQRYRSHAHLTDPADHGADNSVTLVGRKPAWVRVYVRWLFGAVSDVTGTLRVDRRVFPFLWQHVADLAPEPPGTVTATTLSDYAAVRGDTDATLNFVVPADMMRCTLRFTVQVTTPAGATDTHTLTVDARLEQTLRMRIVPVAYEGPDSAGNQITLAAPTLAEAQATAGWSLLVYPVRSTPNISLTSAVQLTFPLTGSPANPGGCAQSWIDLNVLVAQAKTADGNQANTFYYGLVPSAVPIGANSGCASSGVTSGRVGGQITMAHEFGHALGYPHAPCGNVGTGDPNFPAYEPYDPANTPGASIGEYGFDIQAGLVKSPATHKDYMSYCGPRWISLFNYERALNRPILSPSYCTSQFPWWWDELLLDRWPYPDLPPIPDPPPWLDEVVTHVDARQPVISIIGVRHLDGRVEVRSVTRALADPEVPDGQRTSMLAELLDAGHQPIAQARVYRTAARGGGCGCDDGDDDPDAYVFQAYIPTTERGAMLRLVDDGEPVWERAAPKRKSDRPEAALSLKRGGDVMVRWGVDEEVQDVEVWIRYRRPRTEPRIVRIASGGDGEVVLDPTSLPPGKGTLEVVLHDGFHEVTSTRMAVDIPDRDPSVTILHPYEYRTLRARRTMRLHGVAAAANGATIEDDDAYQWTIDGEEVGRGPDLFVTAPDAGEHRVELAVETRSGTATAKVGFTTVDVDPIRQ
jgi:hypothetical protein